jgi:hypothetical protein
MQVGQKSLGEALKEISFLVVFLRGIGFTRDPVSGYPADRA